MSKFCPFCGEELVESAKFCKNCGEKLEVNTFKEDNRINSAQGYNPPQIKKSHNLALIAGYLCAFLIPIFGIIIGIYLVSRKDSDTAKRHGKYVIAVSFFITFLSFLAQIRFM